jgi:hypothetical protein
MTQRLSFVTQSFFPGDSKAPFSISFICLSCPSQVILSDTRTQFETDLIYVTPNFSEYQGWLTSLMNANSGFIENQGTFYYGREFVATLPANRIRQVQIGPVYTFDPTTVTHALKQPVQWQIFFLVTP